MMDSLRGMNMLNWLKELFRKKHSLDRWAKDFRKAGKEFEKPMPPEMITEVKQTTYFLKSAKHERKDDAITNHR